MRDETQGIKNIEMLNLLIDELSAKRPVVLASIYATLGSMPGSLGTRLAIAADGRHEGTIGGGALEYYAMKRAHEMLNPADKEQTPISELSYPKQVTSAMACGGTALVGIWYMQPEAQLLQNLTDLRSAILNNKAIMLREQWGNLTSPTFELLDFEDHQPIWDEDKKTFTEPVYPLPYCYVFGAGHVAHALVPVVANLGFLPVVTDNREEFCTKERFPDAVALHHISYEEVSNHISITVHDYVVVLTHGHAGDLVVLQQVLGPGQPKPAYVGCIGSRKKADMVKARLVKGGADPEAVAALHLPIGLDIKALTPEEIAISIAAQMIMKRRS